MTYFGPKRVRVEIASAATSQHFTRWKPLRCGARAQHFTINPLQTSQIVNANFSTERAHIFSVSATCDGAGRQKCWPAQSLLSRPCEKLEPKDVLRSTQSTSVDR